MTPLELSKVAALVALAEHGQTTDLQEALVQGNNSFRPGALDKMIRAVIAAIREPSDAMVKAARCVTWWEGESMSDHYETSLDSDHAQQVWRAMIDALLGEGT